MNLFGTMGLATGVALALGGNAPPGSVIITTLLGIVIGLVMSKTCREVLTPADLVDARWYFLEEHPLRFNEKKSKNGNRLQYIFYSPAHPDRENGHVEISREDVSQLKRG